MCPHAAAYFNSRGDQIARLYRHMRGNKKTVEFSLRKYDRNNSCVRDHTYFRMGCQSLGANLEDKNLCYIEGRETGRVVLWVGFESSRRDHARPNSRCQESTSTTEILELTYQGKQFASVNAS